MRGARIVRNCLAQSGILHISNRPRLHLYISVLQSSFTRSHLRLVYEGNPMGWVVEQAGGRASTGAGAMLDQEVSVLA